MTMTAILREHAEQQVAEELAELKKSDDRTRPPNWLLSPWAVATYLLGGTLPDGFEVSPKYIGNRRGVAAGFFERQPGAAVATKAGRRRRRSVTEDTIHCSPPSGSPLWRRPRERA